MGENKVLNVDNESREIETRCYCTHTLDPPPVVCQPCHKAALLSRDNKILGLLAKIQRLQTILPEGDG